MRPTSLQVAFERDRLGLARNAGQTEPARAQALGHHAFAAQRPVLADRRDERVAVARVGHGAAHGQRVGDRKRPVAEGDGAGLREEPDLRDLVAHEALGQRGRGEDANLRVVARAAQDEVDHGGIVDGRIGVRAHDEAGDAARRGGGAGARDRLAMLGARLADEAAHVDKARRDDVAGAIDDAGLGGNGIARDGGADPGDEPVDRDEPAPRLGLTLRVDEPGVEESDGLGRRHGTCA